MRVLILGSQGNLGIQLHKLFKTKYQVVAWDKTDLDLTQLKLVKTAIKEVGPDLIINAVAYNNVDQCEEDDRQWQLAKLLNTEIIGVLAEICLETGATLIHYSTDYVFSGSGDQPGFNENSVPDPINKYGQSKLGGEREILKRADEGLNYYLIRTSKLFGPRGRSSLSKPSFFDIILKLAQNKKEMEIVNEELSCFTYTPDLAQSTLELVEDSYGYGIYHIVNSEPVTWYGAAVKLAQLANLETKMIPVRADRFPRPARRPQHSVLLNTKLRSLRPWYEALREYLQIKKS